MGNKKKFIDKKKAATFQLLARDSSDPSYDDGPSGDRVFIRVDNSSYSVDSFFNEPNSSVPGDAQLVDDPNSMFGDAPEDYDDEDGWFSREKDGPGSLPDHVRRELLELGFPDDGYNYLMHLREIKNTGGGSAYYENSKAKLDRLPHDVKAYDASKVEIAEVNDDSADKSIYKVASKTYGIRVQKAVDPEVAALLDDSDLSRFGSDDEDLEEDFLIKANLPEGPVDVELDKKLNLTEKFEVTKKEINDSNTCYPQENVGEFAGGMNEVKSHVLDGGRYSIDEKPRARRLLDEQFDLIELQEYGSETEDEYDGFSAEENELHESLAEKLNHALKDRAMNELERDSNYKAPSDLLHEKTDAKDAESLESAAHVIHRCKEYAEKYENDDTGEAIILQEESSDESEVWDCETIVSTYSNLDNHPARIGFPGIRRKKKLSETVPEAVADLNRLISLKGKEKLPVDFLPHIRKPIREKVKEEKGLRNEQQKRKQHGQESKEEKKERKAAVKEERREARRVKKEIKGVYKGEAQLAQKVAAFNGPSSIHLM